MPRRKPGPKPKSRKATKQPKRELNFRQRRFVEEYLVDGNATQAAIRAGYARNTAGQHADYLLKNQQIAAAIEAGQAEMRTRAQIDQDWAIERLRRWVDVDIGDLAEWDGDVIVLRDSKSLTPALRACVQEISPTPNGLKLKLVDKRACLEDIRRLLGLDEPKQSNVNLTSDDMSLTVVTKKGGASGADAGTA